MEHEMRVQASHDVCTHELLSLSRNHVLRCDAFHPAQCTLYDIGTGTERTVSYSCFRALALLDVQSFYLSDLNEHLRACGNPEISEATAAEYCESGFLTSDLASGQAQYYIRVSSMRPIQAGRATTPIASSPKKAEIHLTQSCNQKCLYCGYDAGSKDFVELPVETWLDILRSLEREHVQSVMISGGEPLLYPGIDRILEHLASARIEVSLLTNGGLLRLETAQRLTSQHIQTSISLDSASPEVHDAVRGVGTHSLAVKAAEMLCAQGARFRLCCTLTSRNTREIRPLADLAVSLGAEALQFGAVVSVGRAAEHPELLLGSRQVSDLGDAIRNQEERLRGRLGVGLVSFEQSEHAQPSDALTDQIYCTGGTSRIAISPDGGLYPCVLAFGDVNFKVGDLVSQSLQELWEKGDWGPMRRSVSASSLVPCGMCPQASICAAKNCRLGAYYHSGDWHGQPALCPIHGVEINATG